MNGAALRGVAACLAVFAATAAAGQTPIPTPKPTPWATAGPVFPVNITRTEYQEGPSVATGKDDGFVVVWSGNGPNGDSRGIVARRFDSVGAGITGEFQVNTTTTGFQGQPSIASDAGGDFVVVWEGIDANGQTDIFGRRYDHDGNPLGAEFQVNTYTTGYQERARVGMSDGGYPIPGAGGFMVVWMSRPVEGSPGQDGDGSGVFARIYDIDGNSLGNEFLVNTFTTGDQGNPSVSMGLYDDVVAVWDSVGQDGDSTGIFAQTYGDDGSPVGGELQVNSYTTGRQFRPDVAVGPDGDFFVTWKSAAVDFSGMTIVAQQFLDPATPLGPEFEVSTREPSPAGGPRVARDQSVEGNFVVVWQAKTDDADPGSEEIFAQRFQNAPFPTSAYFLANPKRQGSEYRINTYTTNAQRAPHVAMGGNGRFVIVWPSIGQDGDLSGVYARRFNYPVGSPMKVDQVPSGGPSNVNGVLESGERVVVDPSWSNPESAPRPLYGMAGNLTGEPGPVYAIDVAAANYGSIAPFGGTNGCDATGLCYEFTVSGVRPAQHWDATFDETLGSDGPLGPVGANQPVTKTWPLHVGGSFPDVPQDPFYPFIENIFHKGITAGGACGAGNYCGEEAVLRQQMAVFLLKASRGKDFVPPAATGAVFDDVPASNPFAPWIEELATAGITGGCTAPPPPALPSFCPMAAVNRQQMAVFLLKTLYGSNFSPGPCQGLFDDVPCSNAFATFIESLSASGIAAGCQADPPLYCPVDSTRRKQMAAFLVKTFGLELYGPD